MDTKDHQLCKTCPKRDTCGEICPALKKNIKQKGEPFETNSSHGMVLRNPKNVVRMDDMKIPGNDSETADAFTYDDLGFNTDAIQLTRTAVFVERFFNRRSFADIADQLNITNVNARLHWSRAIKLIVRMVQALDTKETGHRLMMKREQSFSYDEKCFLLNQVFGFSTREIAEILGKSYSTVKVRVRRLKKKYRAAFDSVEPMRARE